MATSEDLVDVVWLTENIDRPDVVVVDCHWDPNAYSRAHIPGAVSRPGHPYIKDEDDSGAPGTHLPDPGAFAAMMTGLGIGTGSTVVCYDDWHNHFATRLWWLLKYHGHDAVAVLDGGWQGWVAAGKPISTKLTEPLEAGTFRPVLRPERLVGLDELLENLDDPGWLVIDARSGAEYDGSDNSAGNARTGHMPGALNVEWSSLLEERDDGVHEFRSPEGMREIMNDVDADATLVTHCQAGVRATFMAFGLELLGYPDVRVYDGSMGEWANLDRPPLE